VLAKTGGRVVKNVAGHAVHRLLVGSRGTLAVFTEASLKLLPQPTGRVAWCWDADAAALADPERWSAWPRREPAVLSVIGRAVAAKHPVLGAHPPERGPAPFVVVAGFEEDAAWIASCETFGRDTLGSPRLTVRDASVPALWQQLADYEEMPGPRLTFTSAHVTPDALAFLADRSIAERLVFHAPCGRLHVWPEAGEAAELARELEGRGFALIEARGATVPAGATSPSIGQLRARLGGALDPGRVWGLGGRDTQRLPSC
jgi:FAD/FMN-containing dehydrogenase